MTKEMNMEAMQANLKMMDKRGEMAFERAKMNGTLTEAQEKFSVLISNEAFMEKFFAVESAEEAILLFKENGLELSEEEVNVFGKHIAQITKKLVENSGELSEEDLEEVSGGSMFGDVLCGGTVLGSGGAGAGIGTLICPGVGTCIGLLVGAIGGLWLGTEGTQRGWYETAADGITTFAGYTAKGAAITFNNAVSGAKKLGRWIKSWF